MHSSNQLLVGDETEYEIQSFYSLLFEFGGRGFLELLRESVVFCMLLYAS